MQTTGDFLIIVPKTVVGTRWTIRDRLYIAANRMAAAIIFLALSPLLALLTAVIRRDGGPAVYAHYRIGAGGQVFRCLKFRSMVSDADRVLRDLLERDELMRAEWARDQKLRNDPRVTRVGRFLRATSLDELPQLVNVMRGEMALVGPRPITLDELQRYGRTKWHYLAVLPGMTGLWQVSGRSMTTYEERVRLDQHYVSNRSIWLDLKILVRTVHVVMTKDGAR